VQWFSTFVSWRPTKVNKTQFGDPKGTDCLGVLATQKLVATHLLRNTDLEQRTLNAPEIENCLGVSTFKIVLSLLLDFSTLL